MTSTTESTTTLTLPVPPSANEYWRYVNGRVLRSAKATAYKEHAGWLARCAGVPLTEGPVALTIRWYRARRSGDLDNKIKVLCDALNGIAYRDDRQIVAIHAYRYEDKERPRLEMEIIEVP